MILKSALSLHVIKLLKSLNSKIKIQPNRKIRCKLLLLSLVVVSAVVVVVIIVEEIWKIFYEDKFFVLFFLAEICNLKFNNK